MGERVTLSSIRLRVLDGRDNAVWVQSSIAGTHQLPRLTRDDFSFSRSDLVIITNRSDDKVSIHLECIRAAESGLFIGSNRRSGVGMREREGFELRLRAGEALTVRSVDAVEPRSAHGDGTPVAIRPGQCVVLA